MKDAYTAVVKKSGKWWIGWIEEIPGVNCQEATHEKLMESLRVTLGEALELTRRWTPIHADKIKGNQPQRTQRAQRK